LQEAVGTLSTLVVETNQSKTKVAQSADFKLVNGTVLDTENLTAEGRTTTKLTVDAKENEVYTVEKIVAVFTTLETEGDVVAKSKELASKGRTFENVKSDANTGWAKLWDKVDIKVSGDMLSQKLMRIHSFHLLVSGSPNNNNLDASITARGLHGEAYRGHIFWDEIFILPFYDVHFPATAKQILMYRYKRLEAARVYAKENGYEGAMFPWQSGSDGSEETQTVHLNPISGEWGDDYSCFQRHVSLAVAYNVWQYVNVTGDTAFMEQYGAEMILEVARFWSSKATKNETTGRYTIDKVMGPDEFHEAYPGTHQGGLRNNAYTNMMVVWLFEQIPVILEELGSKATEIRNKVNFTDAELQKLEDVKHKLSLEIDKDGIIAQYEGYFELKELDWDYFREKYGNVYRMDRLLKAEGKSADDYKVAKQADTLMTFYNLNKEKIDEILTDLDYTLPENYLEKNLEYYLARTSHGSTLSRVVHAQLAQMVNNEKLSWELFLDAVGSDYNDIQGGTTAEGIHTGVMAATLVVALSTYAGIDLREKLLVVNPHMPKAWNDIEFKMSFKGVEFKFEISHSAVKVIADKATEIVVKGNNVNLEANKLTEIKY
jgi:trehalose/maltose hydrolase-like predicted phosphorylase